MPAAPAELPPQRDVDDRRLLDFLRDRDVACPLCGYNLRDLTQPACPECRQPLSLTVGIGRIRLGWLLLAIAPGIFSGIAAIFFTVILFIATVSEGQAPPWFLIVTDLFGWASGIATILLIVHRNRFLRIAVEFQCLWAILIWAVHIAMFAALLVVAMT